MHANMYSALPKGGGWEPLELRLLKTAHRKRTSSQRVYKNSVRPRVYFATQEATSNSTPYGGHVPVPLVFLMEPSAPFGQ